jgi:hypothetical protein
MRAEGEPDGYASGEGRLRQQEIAIAFDTIDIEARAAQLGTNAIEVFIEQGANTAIEGGLESDPGELGIGERGARAQREEQAKFGFGKRNEDMTSLDGVEFGEPLDITEMHEELLE